MKLLKSLFFCPLGIYFVSTVFVERQDISLFTMSYVRMIKESIMVINSHCKKVNCASLFHKWHLLLCDFLLPISFFEDNWQNKKP